MHFSLTNLLQLDAIYLTYCQHLFYMQEQSFPNRTQLHDSHPR